MKDFPQNYLDGVDLQDFDRLDMHAIERRAERLRAEFIAESFVALRRTVAGLFRSGKTGGEAGTTA